MKKFISMILAALLVFSITTCSSEETKLNVSSEINYADSSYDTESSTDTSENTDTADDTDTYTDTHNNTDTSSDTETDTEMETDTETDTINTLQSDIIFDTSEDTYSYSDNTPKTNISTCKIFKKVVCCGDSYTAGYIANPDGPPLKVNEEYAWPHYMSTATGNSWLNCGCSGCTVLTWQKHARGLPAAQKLGKAQAYVIGLMINDATSSNRVELGSADDIGTDNQTYYGGMSKIIRELNAISPKAKIFVNTCPKSDDVYIEYNQAVRNIVEIYKDQYPVHCIDLAEHADMYENKSLTDDYYLSHYTAIGYEQFAEIYSVILSSYINEHIEDFQDVAFIEYEK